MQTIHRTGQRQEQLLQLYKTAFPSVARMIRKYGGNLEQAREIFQEALLAFYEQTQFNHTVIHTHSTAYLTGIARNLWYKQLQENAREQKINPHDEQPLHEPQSVRSGKLLALLERSGKRCMELLKAFYYDRKDLEDIAKDHGFSGVRSATVQKHKCLEKVRRTVLHYSLQSSDFYE